MSNPRTSSINNGRLVIIIYAPQSAEKCPHHTPHTAFDLIIVSHGTGGFFNAKNREDEEGKFIHLIYIFKKFCLEILTLRFLIYKYHKPHFIFSY